MTARTANASRRALLIAGIGALVVIGALLTFVLVPRRADQQLAAALAALPPLRDTVGLRAERDGAQRMLDSAVAQLAAARPLASPITPAGVDSLRDSTPNSRGTAALEQLVARVRQAPLVESYRALVASPALRGNTAVRAALDTIEALNREREASAALGGPDARYAALTARLTALGQRLERLAESELARRRALSAVPDSMAPSATLTDTTTAPLLSAPLPADTVLEAAVAQQRLVLARTDSALAAARAINDDLLRQQAALRATAQAPIPPLAMLLAALVLGLAVGFAVVLARELRRPTVSTADELLAITGARVLLHDADARRTDGAPDTWVTLHYALTPLDDAAQRITVLADRPVLVEAVRCGLAAEASELTLTGATTARSVASDADVVLVAQRGRTALPWLTEVVRTLALESRRIRAVVLWTGQLPLER